MEARYSTVVSSVDDDAEIDLLGDDPASLPQVENRSPITRKDLSEISDEMLTEYMKALDEAFQNKRGSDISKISEIRPGLNTSQKVVLLPDTIDTEPDNLLLRGMAVLSKSLGYTVRKIPYGDRDKREVSPDDWKFAAGISWAYRDVNQKFNMSRKESPYENGRTFARSQQIIGAFEADKNLGLEALRKSHRWFGNNPGEQEGEGRNKVSVTYLAKTSGKYFIEVAFENELRQLLNSLLRKSWSLLNQDILEDAKEDNVLQYSECVTLFATRDVVVQPAVGKRPAITAKRVPKKPKSNALLLAPELDFLSEVSGDLFSAIAITSKKEWYEAIKSKKFSTVKRRIIDNANQRNEYLAKFASMTTKRLNEIRRMSDDLKTKRKRDVETSTVLLMLSRREDLVKRFADEVISTDPKFEHALKQFWREKLNGQGLDYENSYRLIYDAIRRKGIYEDINLPTRPVQLPAGPGGLSKGKGTGRDASSHPEKDRDQAVEAEILRIILDRKPPRWVEEVLSEAAARSYVLTPDGVNRLYTWLIKWAVGRDGKKWLGSHPKDPDPLGILGVYEKETSQDTPLDSGSPSSSKEAK